MDAAVSKKHGLGDLKNMQVFQGSQPGHHMLSEKVRGSGEQKLGTNLSQDMIGIARLITCSIV
jgi:hypothetical protein